MSTHHNRVPQDHVLELRPDGWGLQHPLACRPSLLDCPVSAACAKLSGQVREYGRWFVTATDDEIVFDGRVPDDYADAEVDRRVAELLHRAARALDDAQPYMEAHASGEFWTGIAVRDDIRSLLG